MKQIHDKLTFTLINKIIITHNQGTGALWLLVFLKDKWCGKIKYCMCVYVRKQIKTSNKSDATSWAATTKSVLITTAIDASEKIYHIFWYSRRITHWRHGWGCFPSSWGNACQYHERNIAKYIQILCIHWVKRKEDLICATPEITIQLSLQSFLFLSKVEGWNKGFFLANSYVACVTNKWVNGSQMMVTYMACRRP